MSTAKHSWFPGASVGYLLVHRVFLGDRGQQMPGRLVSEKLFPADLPDDSSVREKFGAGRFRVTARTVAGQIAGAPYMVDIPDDMGRVPLYEGVEPVGAGGAGGDGITLRDLLNAAEKRSEEQRRHYESLIIQQREDRKADLQFFSSTVDRMAQGFAATKGDGGNDRMVEFLAKRLSDVEKRGESSRADVENWRDKYYRRGGGDSEGVFESIAKGAAPRLMEIFAGGGAESKAASEAMRAELREVRALRERLGRELAEVEAARRELREVRGPRVEGEPAEERAARDALGLTVSAAQVGEYLRGGGVLSEADGGQFRALYREGKLPAAFVALLESLGVLDEPAAVNAA